MLGIAIAAPKTQNSDAAHFIAWKRDGWLASYLPEEVASHYPAQHKDADGMYASWRISSSPAKAPPYHRTNGHGGCPQSHGARLFYSWAMGSECQPLNVNSAGLRSAHALVRQRPGQKPLQAIKLMQEDPVAVASQSEAIKARYNAFSGSRGYGGCGEANAPVGGVSRHRWHPSALMQSQDGATDAQAEAAQAAQRPEPIPYSIQR